METDYKFQLFYKLENGQERVKPLGFGETIIGRGSDCQIKLTDQSVSRRHASLDIRTDGCWLMDLGSANGTQFENKPLSPRRRILLAVGQSFIIGGVHFTLRPIIPGVLSTEIEMPLAEEEEGTQLIEEMAVAETVQAADVVRLQIKDDSGTTKTLYLTDGEWILGRSEDCPIRVPDPVMSRHHAKIKVSGKDIWITDLGSRNGVLYKQTKLPANQIQALKAGDSLTIAKFTLILDVIPRSQAVSGEFVGALPAAPAPGEQPARKPVAAREVSKPLSLRGLEKITIGRAKDNHMVIDHPVVSRYHAVIERMGTRYRLIDMKSHNGTHLNGKRIEGMQWLNEGDRIKIGPEQFVFTGAELSRSTPEGYTIEVIEMNKWVTKDLNLLKNISLYIGQNEFVGLVGMSGAGKTTLQDAINGYRPATDGMVLVNGVNMYENYDMFRNDIGYVPQRDIVHMELTPTSALDYAAQLRMPPDTSREERHGAVDETLDELGLTFRKDIINSRLSGGQLKRVSIGVELLTKPKLFFLDEPTSGLDPGTEYEMMKLLRRLADQGRTIMIITHATKNVMLCDKVIILARGGYLAYFGRPEDALVFFDKYRTPRERLEKDMEFDDIYRILNDESKGTPEEWGKRYKEEATRLVQAGRIKMPTGQVAPGVTHIQKAPTRRISAIQQFIVLSSRGTKILFQDKVSLGLMLCLAPLLGLMNFIWGSRLFDPVRGDSPKTMAMWFMTAVIGILVGSLCSVREIVKEAEIFKRERAVGLKILPYALSKLWVGVALAVYSGIIILLFVIILVRPTMPDIGVFLSWMVSIILCIVVSYLLGLLISAAVPNQNASLIVLIGVIVPQLLFAGVLLPLEEIPFKLGTPISYLVSSRWSFEGFVRASGVFDPLIKDPCWVQLNKDARQQLTDDQKKQCICLGPQLFDDDKCGKIPGIKSPDYYDAPAQAALAQPEPIKPVKPTEIPSPTPLPTPTAYPTPTEIPMSDYPDQDDYHDAVVDQADEYSDERSDQFEAFREQMKTQGDNFADDSRQQFEDYGDSMEVYGDEKTNWKKERESAVAAAESILSTIYDDYGRAFKGPVINRWAVLVIQALVFFGLILYFQKRKDVV